MEELHRLLEIMARLRDPERGCPWDRQQTFRTIAPYTLEEAYEVADAIQREAWGELRDELGDLLFQVVFHARMAEERGDFDFRDVASAIVAKLIGRHPHVFGDAEVGSAQEQSARWEGYKAEERGRRGHEGVLDGISLALPAATRAVKLQRRAAGVGFDWGDVAPVLAKIEEELDEVRAELVPDPSASRLEHEIGDLLFACTNLARHCGVDPEAALRAANGRFERRFRHIEERLREQGVAPAQAGLARMESLWQEAKMREAKDGGPDAGPG